VKSDQANNCHFRPEPRSLPRRIYVFCPRAKRIEVRRFAENAESQHDNADWVFLSGPTGQSENQCFRRSGEAWVCLRLMRKVMLQTLATGCEFTTGGENCQRWAASSVCRAKYLLGPGVVSRACVTLPDESTSTRATTRILPVMVFLALDDTSGRTCRETEPGEFCFGEAWGRADAMAGAGVGAT